MPCKIVGGTKVPGNEKSWERKFLGTKGPGNESSQELSFPGNEKSPEQKFPIGTIRSWERKALGMKSPCTIGRTEKCRLIDKYLNKRYLKQYHFVPTCSVQPF